MNPDTGEIRNFSTTFEAQESGFTVEVPPEKLEAISRMNRKERRKWAAQQRRKPKPARKRKSR